MNSRETNLLFLHFKYLMMKFIPLVVALLLTFSLNGQTDSIQPPYKRFPTPPPFKLLLTDSSSYFTKADLEKKKPLLIMLFSPDCDHCKHGTEELIKNIDKFKKVQIVMATFQPFADMKKFYADFQLNRYENIIVGKDINFILPPFYNIRNMPFLAFYDKKGQLISVFEGNLPMDKIAEKFGN
jgi:cytochrome oxidase Cu insertion factor (SCO1/SenC/PrrC family)